MEPAPPYEYRVKLPDGRVVSVLEVGTTTGMPVLALHGTPGSRLKYRAVHEAAIAAGIRLMAPDRWGYAQTTAPPRPTLDAYADDLGAIADATAIERFGLLGISGGGPFAAVAAGRLRQRITRTALVSPMGPVIGAQGAGISAFHRICFNVFAQTPGMPRLVFAAYRTMLLRAPRLSVSLAAWRVPPVDRAIIKTPEFCRRLTEASTTGLASSSLGPAIDLTLFSKAWTAAAMPPGTARVWIGLEDANVPIGSARTLSAQLGAELTELPGAGHYWFIKEQNIRSVLDWLRGSPEIRELR